MPIKDSKLTGIVLLTFCLIISGASAYVYQQNIMTATQNIVEIASFTIKSSDLGNIKEGQTLVLTESEISSLGSAVTITTTTAPVYLHFTSDLDDLDDSYTTFNINILYDSVPPGGAGSGIAGTLSITSHDLTIPVTLDVAGTWIFDLTVETAADSVDSNISSNVSILVEAKSTN